MSTARIYDLNAERQVRSNRMENQKHGYIPLYRSVKKQPWAKDVYLRTLWENILLDAARKPYTANYKGHRWPLETGQLVTTSADLGLALCDRNGEPTSRHAVERMLAVFEKEGMISVHAERRKGTLITVVNYAEYAEKMSDLPAHNSAHKLEHNEPSTGAPSEAYPAHNPEHKAAHHEQEGNNNNNKKTTSENSKESSDSPSQSNRVNRPDAAIQTPKGDKWGTSEDLKAAEWIFSKIQTVSPASQVPAWSTWANDIRLMRNALKIDHYEICEVFKWANLHHFWQTNVLSPAKLREKWETLKAQKNQEPKVSHKQPAEPTPHWNSPEGWKEFL